RKTAGAPRVTTVGRSSHAAAQTCDARRPVSGRRASSCARCLTIRHGDRHWHVSRPCGSGSVQLFVVPSCVIVTFAVAVPSYVTTSRRVVVCGVLPVNVTVADIARISVPAVGYGCGVAVVGVGITSAFVVSPVTRVDVNAPAELWPVVDSLPDAVALT